MDWDAVANWGELQEAVESIAMFAEHARLGVGLRVCLHAFLLYTVRICCPIVNTILRIQHINPCHNHYVKLCTRWLRYNGEIDAPLTLLTSTAPPPPRSLTSSHAGI